MSRSRIFRNTAIFSVFTGLSRIAGLGRMLERMTNHADTTPAARASSGSIAERVSDRMNRARPADADFDDLASPDSAEDNVEIPAFLRRQAN